MDQAEEGVHSGELPMQLEVIGPRPLAMDAQGQLATRIGTLFPAMNVLFTAGFWHCAWQRPEFSRLPQPATRAGFPSSSYEAAEEQTLAVAPSISFLETETILVSADL